MTIPQPNFSADFWAAQGWTAPWLHDVDPAYRREMIPAICENMIRRKAGWRDFILTPEGRLKLRVQLCTRLSQARESFVPWLEQSRPLGGLNVLEIGCGSGSAAAALARAGARVTKRYETFTAEAQRNLYRGGRGVSWHEFDLVFGMEAIAVVLDGYSPRSVDQKNCKPDQACEEALAGLFARMDPPVPRGFCRPSLELLIDLTA